MPIRLSPAADKLLRHARRRYPDAMKVAGLAERTVVRELENHNLVVESDAQESAGYSAKITATPWRNA